MAKTQVLHVRVSDDLRRRVEEAARDDLRSVSSWVANLVEKTLARRAKREGGQS